jgi:predicted dehydrogenase
MSNRLKIGLIGAGIFAGYHANKLTAHPRVEFTGVVDRSGKRAAALGEKHGIPVLSLTKLLHVSDAVIIASAASAHGDLAVRALKSGCHCLIEKPMCTSRSDGNVIRAMSTGSGLVVQVGHQERMVLQAIGLDRIEARPSTVEAVRNSTYSERGTDVSVTLDLMTHDIDLCNALLGGAPDNLEGASGKVRSKTADMAYAKLKYGSTDVRLSASRVADVPERWMKLTYDVGEVFIDFNAKTLSHTTPFDLNLEFGNDPRAKDSLGAATDIFVKAVLDGTPVLVTAEAGAIATNVALVIDMERE